jgi:hypothetical protein
VRRQQAAQRASPRHAPTLSSIVEKQSCVPDCVRATGENTVELADSRVVRLAAGWLSSAAGKAWAQAPAPSPVSRQAVVAQLQLRSAAAAEPSTVIDLTGS